MNNHTLTPEYVETMWAHYNNELCKLRASGVHCGDHYYILQQALDYYTAVHEMIVPIENILN